MDKCPKCGYNLKEATEKERIVKLAEIALRKGECDGGMPECLDIHCCNCPFQKAENLLKAIIDA